MTIFDAKKFLGIVPDEVNEGSNSPALAPNKKYYTLR